MLIVTSLSLTGQRPRAGNARLQCGVSPQHRQVSCDPLTTQAQSSSSAIQRGRFIVEPLFCENGHFLNWPTVNCLFNIGISRISQSRKRGPFSPDNPSTWHPAGSARGWTNCMLTTTHHSLQSSNFRPTRPAQFNRSQSRSASLSGGVLLQNIARVLASGRRTHDSAMA